MMSALTKRPQAIDDPGGGLRSRRVPEIGQNANDAVLGERACGPSTPAAVGEPVVGDIVMHVIGVEQRDEKIDVEKRGTGCRCHGSSRRRLTSASVGFGLEAGRRGRRGTPLRTVARVFGASA